MISSIHPDYESIDWEKWRLTYKGGREFLDRYLQKFSLRETQADFLERKNMTYVPRFAGAAIDEVKNSIYQRFPDVVRKNGSSNYKYAVGGKGVGVDLKGSTMNSFIGTQVLVELLLMGKVGVFVDSPEVSGTLVGDRDKHPYLYIYKAEDIRNWVWDKNYQSVLLRDYVIEYDDFGFPSEYIEQYRHLVRDGNTVFARIYDENDEVITEKKLNLKQIPFVMGQLSNSLMSDICDYQVTLMNLSSSDVSYALRSNFPFYTEQYDAAAESAAKALAEFDGDENTTEENIKGGATHGRKYGKGLERPQFIHPSSEPLTVSMEKQSQIKEEIKLLLNLSIANLQPVRASSESKRQDEGSLESGLSYIGEVLEYMENSIGVIWHDYENSSEVPEIKYPDNYTIRSDNERQTEIATLTKTLGKVGSITFQKELAKKIALLTLGNSVTVETHCEIERELDVSIAPYCDVDTISSDVEDGILSPETAAKIRLYPKDEAAKAKEAHLEKLKDIQLSQTDPKLRGEGAKVEKLTVDRPDTDE